MRKTLGTAVACLALAAGVLPATTASAQRFVDQDRYVERYCNDRWDRDCDDWKSNRTRWDRDRYDRWYRDRRDYFGPDDAAATIFGFVAGAAAGAITGSINGAADSSHVARCDARYRSYDPASDTFLGYDGERHYCRL
jgi:hypothetical protein